MMPDMFLPERRIYAQVDLCLKICKAVKISNMHWEPVVMQRKSTKQIHFMNTLRKFW